MRNAIIVLGSFGTVALLIIIAAIALNGTDAQTYPTIPAATASGSISAADSNAAATELAQSTATRAVANATLTAIYGMPTSTWPPVVVTKQPTNNTTPILRAPTAVPNTTPNTPNTLVVSTAIIAQPGGTRIPAATTTP